tara:strand:- start:274 stop:1749 length:1476 start_codon:yes stop_codon:yes gene_type:complete
MKLFQRLLVAPAALGLMAPVAANAADLNINGVSDYSASTIEAQNYSDVLPTDWAFKALTDLAERNGCAVATPSESMTRYEAAALLNKCLGNISEVTAEEKQLINEFSPELAVIKARMDGLEARVGEFEAGQFSSSTKMSGKAAFITGYVDDDAESNTDSITMEYMYQLNLNTSFTGEDNLYTRIKTGNVSDHFKDKGQGTYLSAANGNGDVLKVDKLWYQFPVGDSLTVWVGPKIENYYMLASAPSIYKPVLKQFALGPNGSAYGSSTSPGFGAAWTQDVEDPSAPRWAVSANYSAKSGGSSADKKGLFGEDTESFVLTKVEYGSPRWQVSLGTAFKEGWDNDGYYQTALAKASPNVAADSSMTAYALRGYWKPEVSGTIPEIQVGYDFANIDGAATGEADETSGWMVGLGWKDLFIDGNRAGIAFGSRQAATSIKGGGSDPSEDNSVWEAYYTFKVNDGVSITPAVFGGSDVESDGKDVSGAVLLTEFRF